MEAEEKNTIIKLRNQILSIVVSFSCIALAVNYSFITQIHETVKDIKQVNKEQDQKIEGLTVLIYQRHE